MPTQAERRVATRSQLLDAAVDRLVDGGLRGFTTSEVGRRAGLSNGALFRHFPTKADLLAATVEQVFERLRADYEDTFEALSPEERTTRNLLELLWRQMSDPALAAVYEVYTAARTDTWMQAAIEPVTRDHMDRLQQLARELLGRVPDVDPAFVDRAVMLSILAMQGLVVNLMARPQPDAGDELVEWLAALGDVLLPSAGRAPAAHEGPAARGATKTPSRSKR